MKNILLVTLAIGAALTVGCGRRNSSSAQQQAAQPHSQCSHNHDAHEGDSNHDHGEAGAPHSHAHDADLGDHAHAGCCGHDHGEGSHQGNAHGAASCAGHNHGAASEEGYAHGDASHHGHKHESRKAGRPAASDPHAGHNHDHGAAAHAGHNHGQGNASATGHDHSHGGGEVVDPDEIVFPASQAARTDFEVQTLRRGPLRETIVCGGRISASQSSLTVVSAPVAGIVTPFDGRIMANTTVTEGQELFNLSSSSLASGDAIAKARINYEQAKANFERTSGLFEDKLVTQRDYLDAQSAYLTAQAEYEPVRVSDGRGGAIITAPTDGYITQMSVSTGDFVEMGQPLATIARSGRMQLSAQVSQRYFDRLADVVDANFRTPSSQEWFTVSGLGGKLYSAGRMVSSSLIPVVFEFDGGGHFPDGSVADVVLLGRSREDVLSLPVTAITEQQGLYYVYIQLDEECYSRREVRLGAGDGLRVEILSGVKEGERVVTRGAINVKMASASGAIPHGHTH